MDERYSDMERIVNPPVTGRMQMQTPDVVGLVDSLANVLVDYKRESTIKLNNGVDVWLSEFKQEYGYLKRYSKNLLTIVLETPDVSHNLKYILYVMQRNLHKRVALINGKLRASEGVTFDTVALHTELKSVRADVDASIREIENHIRSTVGVPFADNLFTAEYAVDVIEAYANLVYNWHNGNKDAVHLYRLRTTQDVLMTALGVGRGSLVRFRTSHDTRDYSLFFKYFRVRYSYADVVSVYSELLTLVDEV